MGILYGRAGRLTAENGGFRPGQSEREVEEKRVAELRGDFRAFRAAKAAGGQIRPPPSEPGGGGSGSLASASEAGAAAVVAVLCGDADGRLGEAELVAAALLRMRWCKKCRLVFDLPPAGKQPHLGHGEPKCPG